MLKIWLPLDGDLRNLGTSDIEVTNNGVTVDNAGKIGKCYYFNGSAQYLQLSKTLGDIYSSDFSWCVWLKPTDNTRGIIFSEYAASGSSGVAFELLANRVIRVYWNGSPDWNFGISIDKDEWSHVAITKKNNTIKVYVNGQYRTEKTGTLSARPSTACIRLGDDYRGGTNVSYMGYMNDARIYDHCLSAAEVREIAMGLVLHYKLDDMKIKTGTNLVTGVTGGNRVTKLTDGRIGVQTTGENADTYFTINLSESITNGTKYFLSCDASGISEGAYWGFPLGAQSNSTLLFKIYNGHNEYSFTANDINWGSNRLFMDDVNRADWANKATFWNFELYKTPTLEVEDSSGYGHNGETINEVTISSDTPRYNSSVQLNGSNTAIKVPDNKWMVQGAEAITINLWAKSSAWAGAHLFSCTESGGFNTEAGSSGYLRFPIHVYTNAEKTSTAYKYDSKEIQISALSTTDWNMITFVYDSTGTRTYINGNLHHTYSNVSYGIHFNTNARLFLGCEANTASPTTPYFNGEISDFRIYYTPLLDTDIKLLYNMSMRVDNLGGVHAFEFDEKSGRELLAGTPITTSYSNHTNVYTNYTNGEIKLTGSSSVSTPYIPISPSGKTYYYDLDVSVDANNQVYIGFERYDVNKTARSNNATVYVMSPKPSTALTHQRYRGTVNLSTDGVNPCAFITLRILNDWSGAASRSMTVHKISLREVTTIQSPKLYKTGIFTVDELNEHLKSSLYKNGFVEATEFIEI